MKDPSALFPKLTRSFKRRFDFRLCAPSFVYPAGYAENVRRLGPFVDEIELLLFESRSESLPSRSEFSALISSAQQFDFSYHVHLPLDLQLGAASQIRRNHDVRRLIEIIDLVRPLCPATHTLHLTSLGKCLSDVQIGQWQERTLQSLDRMLRATRMAPGRFTIETLDYPPQWFAPIVDRLGLMICVDVGHVLKYGWGLQSVMREFGPKIDVIHLHGMADGQDHLALDHLASTERAFLQSYLQTYKGAVSLEVFCFERLARSLDVLDRMMSAAHR
jgi:adenosylcobalamin phosphodiesterase